MDRTITFAAALSGVLGVGKLDRWDVDLLDGRRLGRRLIDDLLRRLGRARPTTSPPPTTCSTRSPASTPSPASLPNDPHGGEPLMADTLTTVLAGAALDRRPAPPPGPSAST